MILIYSYPSITIEQIEWDLHANNNVIRSVSIYFDYTVVSFAQCSYFELRLLLYYCLCHQKKVHSPFDFQSKISLFRGQEKARIKFGDFQTWVSQMEYHYIFISIISCFSSCIASFPFDFHRWSFFVIHSHRFFPCPEVSLDDCVMRYYVTIVIRDVFFTFTFSLTWSWY